MPDQMSGDSERGSVFAFWEVYGKHVGSLRSVLNWQNPPPPKGLTLGTLLLLGLPLGQGPGQLGWLAWNSWCRRKMSFLFPVPPPFHKILQSAIPASRVQECIDQIGQLAFDVKGGEVEWWLGGQ